MREISPTHRAISADKAVDKGVDKLTGTIGIWQPDQGIFPGFIPP